MATMNVNSSVSAATAPVDVLCSSIAQLSFIPDGARTQYQQEDVDAGLEMQGPPKMYCRWCY